MRIAALITGRTRHFWYTLPSIFKNVIKPNNIDVYCYLSKNSNCNYEEKVHSMPEKEIIQDCLGEHLKGFCFDTDDETFERDKALLVEQFQKRVGKINTKNYKLDHFWYYKNGKHQKANEFVDEWLKIKKCSQMIKEQDYDIVLRIRPDIPFLNEMKIEATEVLKVNHQEGWVKEYLFYGPTKIAKFVCENFVDYLGANTKSWARGDEELSLVNEIQFGKFLADHGIIPEVMKEHSAGKFYSFYNVDKSKYLKYSNFVKEPLVCYLDAGTFVEELEGDNIYNLYE